ncbi:hypothetical protein LPN04_33175 [Rugamonas sp. A1-17]|nr:hypothetical protein [Rugamonas sp. A1-17]MCU6502658.1 hypothetical protein [Rugamonas sp. A1-17]
MIITDVVAQLTAFVPEDEVDNVARLYEILDRLQALAPELRTPVVPAMLSVIERYPDAELGSPGPLVHELESIPGYESFLMDSVLRQPADLNVWMVNRIVNSEVSQDVRLGWLSVMNQVLKHARASKEVQRTVSDFLEHQRS